MSRPTVLISGGGIAGPALAFWLLAAGFEATLVERAPSQRRGGFVIDFWGLGYDLAERMGLAEGIERVGYHVRELRIVNERGAKVAGFGTAVFRELTGGRFVTLRRSELSALLFEKISGSTEIIFGEEVVALNERADCVQVQFEKSGERLFDLVIGADGLHSKVRSLAFGPQERFERQLGYGVAAFEVQGYRPRDEDVYIVYCEPGRTLARFAMRDDRTLFLFVFTLDRTPAMSDPASQKGVLRELYGRGRWECPQILAELDRTDELYFDRVDQVKMNAWSRSRIALVGDAAFCVSLMAGQGSALAMIAAYVMAGELAQAAGQYDRAFANYEVRLRNYIAIKQEGAKRFSAAFAPKTRWGLLLRNQIIKSCAIPGVASLAFGREITDSLQLPDYQWPSLERTAGCRSRIG
jgi:2-polyprenyl-6-methoxyphenol hydroxylase-like FAD-dependent oxidoreductase